MKELWLKGKRLIPETEWMEEITSLKSKEQIKGKGELRKKLISAIEDRIPHKKFGIFFSGGVDSSLIAAVCKKAEADFVCYTVGFQDDVTKEPEDIIEAKKVASELGLNLKYKIFDLKEAEKIIKKTITTLKPVNKTDVVNIGVGAVVLAAISLGKEDNIDYFLGGLGSEEIFAGYERHNGVKDVNQECWTGLKAMWGRDLVRDFNLSKELKVTVRTPFLDSELIKCAMKLSGEEKINDKGNKVILREIAEEFLGSFAWRKKKAAQYGSCFDKAIEKLAKKDGFKFKKEWLNKIESE
ncbi:hypothetical protein GOV03_02375 [Candidatus Woesearchaeota archaeon]|nr:hypothetical protein [Candidatus Woesearchaeota archaeon]